MSENTKLQMDLDKARREIRVHNCIDYNDTNHSLCLQYLQHLKGQLSILQLTPAGIREERARTQQREKRKAEQLSYHYASNIIIMPLG